MLRVELQTNEIPDVFAQFRDVVDERYWLKQATLIKENLRGRPFLANLLNREYAIALALTRCSNLAKQYGRIPIQETENRSLYPAMSFAAQVLSIRSLS